MNKKIKYENIAKQINKSLLSYSTYILCQRIISMNYYEGDAEASVGIDLLLGIKKTENKFYTYIEKEGERTILISVDKEDFYKQWESLIEQANNVVTGHDQSFRSYVFMEQWFCISTDEKLDNILK
jgi:hypothetical protein